MLACGYGLLQAVVVLVVWFACLCWFCLLGLVWLRFWVGFGYYNLGTYVWVVFMIWAWLGGWICLWLGFNLALECWAVFW